MAKKDWDDQPDVIECDYVERVVRIGLGGGNIAVVYKHNEAYYVTTGSLFGSQTHRCLDVARAWLLVGLASYASTDKPVDLPDHCWLVTP